MKVYAGARPAAIANRCTWTVNAIVREDPGQWYPTHLSRGVTTDLKDSPERHPSMTYGRDTGRMRTAEHL
jgi:hypothetical protein